MSYRRFDLADALNLRETPVATVATNATVAAPVNESVATVATVAALPTNPFEAAGTQDDISLDAQPDSGSEQSAEIWGAEDWQTYFEERAAIREFSGGFAR